MFYRNAGRSTVLDRIESHRGDARPDATDEAAMASLDTALLDARRRSEQQARPKLSSFEKELLLAWAQDY
jgi:hypothetical protein